MYVADTRPRARQRGCDHAPAAATAGVSAHTIAIAHTTAIVDTADAHA